MSVLNDGESRGSKLKDNQNVAFFASVSRPDE